jgi:XRE family transcriptional regulator, stress-response regulator
MAEVAYIGPGGREPRSGKPRPLLRTLIGAALRRARLEQGRTLAEVARAARVSMPYLSELERGRKEASSEVLAAICEALRIDLADVLTEVRLGLVPTRRPTVPSIPPLDRPAQRSSPMRGRPGDVVLLAA